MDFFKLWTPASADEPEVKISEEVEPFDYSNIDSVLAFNDTHPSVMHERIAAADWDSKIEVNAKRFKNVKHSVLYFLWKLFGWRPFEYRNYKKI